MLYLLALSKVSAASIMRGSISRSLRLSAQKLLQIYIYIYIFTHTSWNNQLPVFCDSVTQNAMNGCMKEATAHSHGIAGGAGGRLPRVVVAGLAVNPYIDSPYFQ